MYEFYRTMFYTAPAYSFREIFWLFMMNHGLKRIKDLPEFWQEWKVTIRQW